MNKDTSWIVDMRDFPALHMSASHRNHFGYFCCTCGFRMSYFHAHHKDIKYRCRNQHCPDNYLMHDEQEA